MTTNILESKKITTLEKVEVGDRMVVKHGDVSMRKVTVTALNQRWITFDNGDQYLISTGVKKGDSGSFRPWRIMMTYPWQEIYTDNMYRPPYFTTWEELDEMIALRDAKITRSSRVQRLAKELLERGKYDQISELQILTIANALGIELEK